MFFFVGMVVSTSNSEISNGQNWRAILSNRGLSTTVGTARTALAQGKGPSGPVGCYYKIKMKNVFVSEISVQMFRTFFENQRQTVMKLA